MNEMTVVGLHICGKQVRLAELRRMGRGYQILRLEQQRLESAPRRPAPMKTDGRALIASLPISDVMSRCWSLPAVEEDKFKQMIAHRLEADLPVAIGKMTWGYRKLGRSSTAPTAQDVLVQAARTEQVERVISLLSNGGMDVDVLTTESEALGGLYRYGLQAYAKTGTEIIVIASLDEWLVGVAVEGTIRSVRRVRPETGPPESICRQCCQSIEAQVPLHQIQHVSWCGTPAFEAARECLAQMLGRPVVSAEPNEQIVHADGRRLDADELAQFGPTIGLALSGFSEREQMVRLAGRPEVQEPSVQNTIQRILSHPWRGSGVAAALLILAGVLHVGSIRSETKHMRTLLAEATQNNSSVSLRDPKVLAVQRLKKYRIDVEGIVANVCAATPDNVVISSIQLGRDGRLTLKGTTEDPKSITLLAKALQEKLHRFANVIGIRSEPEKGGAFTISAALVGVEKYTSSGRGVLWK